jgi:hypothetical protein
VSVRYSVPINASQQCFMEVTYFRFGSMLLFPRSAVTNCPVRKYSAFIDYVIIILWVLFYTHFVSFTPLFFLFPHCPFELTSVAFHILCLCIYRKHLFIGLTWVTGARKDKGPIKLCSIATLLKITSAFYKLFFYREHLLRKHMPNIMCQGYISTGKHS